jgi:endonuclease NucS-like protein
MPKPTGSRAFPVREAYPFAEAKNLGAEANRIREMDVTWDRPYGTTVRRGFLIELFGRGGLLQEFKEKHWPYGLTAKGESECRRCLKIKDEFEAARGGTPTTPIDSEDGEDQISEKFALESHLRDFLAKNPDRIEAGMRVYSTPENEGVEFPVDDGRIDLLTVDRDGKFVIVELKVSRGRSKALGQLLYYMGWVDKNLGNGPCRGMVIASEINDDLVTAVSRVPGVSLLRYRMNFSLESVAT